MRTNFLLLMLLMWACVTTAQTPQRFKKSGFVVPTTSVIQTQDSLPSRSINFVTKQYFRLKNQQVSVNLPQNYNWTKAVRLNETFKQMELGYRQDALGRSLPVDIIQQVKVDVLYKSIPPRY